MMYKNNISTNNMNKTDLKKLSKSQLIKLLLANNSNSQQELTNVSSLQQEATNKRTVKRKPIPAPRKNVKKMIENYEENIIDPPIQFQDKPTITLKKRKKN